MQQSPRWSSNAIRSRFVTRLNPVTAAVAAALIAAYGPAHAGPTGEQVVGGSATVQRPDANTTVINQATQRAALNWNGFSIDAGQSVIFNQPNAASVALNRVVGPDPSRIAGSLQANGQVFLINPSGILFSGTSSVNVAGLVASTLDIGVNDFMNGRHAFSGIGKDVTVEKGAKITAGERGYVALLANRVFNSGEITANNGTVALGAGSDMVLDFHGDGLLSLKVNAAAAGAKIAHDGLIVADGGRVIMSAAARNALLDTVLNVDGIVQAHNAIERNGAIYLEGGDSGATRVAGTIDGGTVSIATNDLALTGTVKGADGVTLAPVGATEIALGANASGKLSITQPMLDNVITGAVLTIGSADAGAITLAGPVRGSSSTWQTLSLVTADRIADANPDASASIAATSLAMRAVNGIGAPDMPLRTQVRNLAFVNTGAGGVSFDNHGALSITSVAGITNSDGGSGAFNLRTHSPMTFAVDATFAGDMTFDATESAAAGDDITVNADVTVKSTGGSLTFRAGDNVRLLSGSKVVTEAAGKSVTLISRFNDTDGIGSMTFDTATVSTNGGDIQIYGGNTLGASTAPVSLTSSTLTSGAGNIGVRGTSTSTLGNAIGVSVSGGTIQSTSGTIDIVGKGGTANSGTNLGVLINNNASINSGAGNIKMSGTAGSSSIGSQVGVLISGNFPLPSSTAISTSAGGNIDIIGTGGTTSDPNAPQGNNAGITVQGGAVIDTSAGAGSITLKGTGGSGGQTPRNFGVWLLQPSTQVVAGTGSIALEGTGGSAAGLKVEAGTTLGKATMTGDILLRSLSGTGISIDGVSISPPAAAAAIRTGGNVTLNASGGGSVSVNGLVVANGLRLVSDTANASFDLSNGSNNAAKLAVNAPGASVTYRDADGLDIGSVNTVKQLGESATPTTGVEAAGSLTITTAGDITQSERVIASGESSFNAGAHSIDLSNDANNFNTVALSNSGTNDITVVDTNSLILSSTSFGRNLTATAKSGSITLATGQAFTRKTSGAGSTLRLNATGDINVNSGVQIKSDSGVTGGLSIVLNADSDHNNNGRIDLKGASGSGNGVTFTSNGGSITLGGRDDTLTAAVTGVATGNGTDGEGVRLSFATLNAGAGSVAIFGKGGTHLATLDGNNHGVLLTDSTVSANGGITVMGTGGTAGRDNYGVDITSNSLVTTAGAGVIAITGTGGAVAGSANQVGIQLNGGADITSTGSGGIVLNGTGGAGSTGNPGVNIGGAGTSITTAAGNIGITGFGKGNGQADHGVAIFTDALVSTSGSGQIAINGTVDGGTMNNIGVFLSDAQVTSTGASAGAGTITITGSVTSAGATSGNQGVTGQSAATVSSVRGDIAITGTGGGSGASNSGVLLGGLTVESTGAAAISLTGTGGGTNPVGIDVFPGANNTIRNTAGAAPITLTADGMTLAPNAGGVSITNVGNSVTLRTLTAGTAINLGSTVDTTPGTLELSGAEVNKVTAGTLVIGRNDAGAASGDITISQALSPAGTTKLALFTAGSVTQTAALGVVTLSGAAGSVSLTDANNLVSSIDGFTTASGFTLVDSAGGLTIDGAVTGGSGLASITTAGGVLDVNAGVTGANVTLASTNSITLDAAVTTAGTLTLNAGLFITQTAALSAGTLTGNAGLASLTNAGNTVGSLGSFTTTSGLSLVDSASGLTVDGAVTGGSGLASISTTGGVLDVNSTVTGANVTLQSTDNNITLDAAATTAGTLTLNAGGSIAQTAALSASTLDLTAGGSVTLNAANNAGTLIVSAAGQSVSYTDADALALGGITAGTLNLATAGAITQTAPITVTGTTTLTANASAMNVTLNDANNFGTLTLVNGSGSFGAVAARDVDALVLGGGTAASLLLNVGGALTQSGALTVPGTTRIVANGGIVGIDLSTHDNDFGTLRFAEATAGGGFLDVSFRDATGGVILDSGAARNLSIVSTGNITQTSVLLATGTSTFTADTTTGLTLDLGTSANNFIGAVSFAGANGGSFGSVSLRDSNALVLGGGSAASLALWAGGNITQTAALNVSGATTVSADTNSIAVTLALPNNDFASVGFGTHFNGGSISTITLADIGGIVLAGGTAGTLSVAALGGITQTAPLTLTTLTGSTIGLVTLDNSGNAIANLGTFAANGFTLVDGSALTVAGNVDAGAGALSLTASGGVLTNNAILSSSTSVELVADQMTLGGTIGASKAGTGKVPIVVLRPATASRLISLGGADSAGALGLTSAELATINATTLQVGRFDAGNITVDGHIALAPAKADNLLLASGGTVSGSAGIEVTGLAVQGTAMTLDGASNNVTTLAANLRGERGASTYIDSDALTVGQVGAVTGISTSGAGLNVTAGSIDVIQPITTTPSPGTGLDGGAITLTATGGITSALTGTITTSGAAGAFGSSEGGGSAGAGGRGGDLVLRSTGAGTIALAGRVSADGGAGGSGAFTIGGAAGAGGSGGAGGQVTIANGGGPITLTARVSADGGVGGNGGNAIFSGTGGLGGSGGDGGVVTLSTSGGTIALGDVSAVGGGAGIKGTDGFGGPPCFPPLCGGPLPIAPFAAAAVPGGPAAGAPGTIQLSSTGGITQAAGTAITGGNLLVLAGGDVLLNNANAVDRIAARLTAGSFGYTNSKSLTVDSITPVGELAPSGTVNGIQTTGATSATTLNVTSGDLVVNAPVGNADATTTLVSAGNITGSGTVTGATVVLDSGTGIGLNSSNRLSTAAGTLAARTRGTSGGGVFVAELDGVTLATVGSVTNGSAGLPAYDVRADGTIAIEGPVATTGGAVTLQSSTGAITSTSAGTITTSGTGGSGAVTITAATSIDLFGAITTKSTRSFAPKARGGDVTFSGPGGIAVSAIDTTGSGSDSVPGGAAAGDIAFGSPASITLRGNITAKGGDGNLGFGAAGNGANLTFGAPVILGGNVTIDTRAGSDAATPGTAGTVTFSNTIDSPTTARALTITTPAQITFGGAVGGTAPLASLTTNGGGAIAVNGGRVSTTGAQTYDNTVTLGGATNSAALFSGSALTFNGSPALVATAHPLTLTTDALNLNGNLTGTAALTIQPTGDTVTMGIAGGTGTLLLPTTTLDKLSEGFASLTFGRATSTAATNVGAVTFQDPVAIRGGSVAVNGDIIGSGDASITLTSGAGGIALGGDVATASQAVALNGEVTLSGATRTVSAGSGPVTFSGAIDGGSNLVVSSTGATTFNGAIGSTTPLASLTTNAGGTTLISGRSIRTSGNQSYGDAVTLGANTVLTGAAPTFSSTVNGGGFDLALSFSGTTAIDGARFTAIRDLATGNGGTTTLTGTIATTGSQTYGDAVVLAGATTIDTGTTADATFDKTVDGPFALAVNSGGTTTFGGLVGGPLGPTQPLTTLTTDAPGRTVFSGGGVRTSGSQTYNDAVTLGADTTLRVINSGDIDFRSTIDGPFNLTTSAFGGLLGTRFGGAVGSQNALHTLSVGTAALDGGSITTTGDQIFGIFVTLGADTVLEAGAGNITFNNSLNGGFRLTANSTGVTTFSDTGSTAPLRSITTNSGGSTRLASANLLTTDDQVYGDDFVATQGALINSASGSLTFGGKLTAGANAVTLRANGIDFNGGASSVTGTSFIQLQPASDSVSIGIAGAPGTLQLSSSDIAALADGFSGISIGALFGGGSTTTVNAVTFMDPVTISQSGGSPAAGRIVVAGKITGTDNASVRLNGGSNGTIELNNDIATSNQPINLDGAVTVGINAVLSAGTGDITLGGLNGPAGITLNSAGLTSIGGAGNTTPLAFINTDGPGRTRVTGTVTTTGAQVYNDPVLIPFFLTVNAADATFGSTVDTGLGFGSPADLTLNVTGTARFAGAVGEQSALRTIATGSAGATRIDGSVVTTLTQTYNNAVTIGGDAVLSSSGDFANSDITFAKTVNSVADPNALTVNSRGIVRFDGAVGGATPLASLATDAGGTTRLGAGVTTTGAQTYRDSVVLAGNATLTGTTPTFAGSVTGAGFDLALDFSDPTAISGTRFTGIRNLSTGGGGTTSLTGTITTSGTQNYGDAVTLAGATTVAAGANAITFEGTVDGGFGLIANTTGTTTFGGAIGATTPLASLTTNAGGTTLIGGGAITTTGAQTYNDNVTLGGNTTLTGTTLTFGVLNGANSDLTLSFTGTTAIDGAKFTGIRDLVSAGATTLTGTLTTTGTQVYSSDVTLAGNTTLTGTTPTFSGNVNGANNDLTLNFSGTIAIDGAKFSGIHDLSTAGATTLTGAFTTTGTQVYGGNVTLVGATTLAGTTPTFSGNVNGANNDLTLNFSGTSAIDGAKFSGIHDLSTAGATTLTGALTTTGTQVYGGNVTLVGSTTLAGTTPTFSGNVNGANNDLTLNFTGTTAIDGAKVTNVSNLSSSGATTLTGALTTTSTQTYGGNVTLAGNTTLAGTTPTFGGTVTGANNDLTLNFSGTTAIDGATFTGIRALTTGNGGATTLTGALTTTGTQTYNDNVTLVGNTVLNSGAGSITFAGTLESPATPRALTITSGNVLRFAGLVGGNGNPLGSLTTTASSTRIDGGAITTTGSQSYNNPVVVGANTSLNSTAGNISFGGALDADAAASSRTLLVNAPIGTVTFSGSIGANAAFADFDVISGPNTIVFNGSAPQTVNTTAGGDGTVSFSGNVRLDQSVAVSTTGNNVTFANGVETGGATNRTLAVNAATGNIGLQTVGNATPLAMLMANGNVVSFNQNAVAQQIVIGANQVLTNGTATIMSPMAFAGFDGPAALTLSGPASGGVYGADGGMLHVDVPGLLLVTPNGSRALPTVWLEGDPAKKPFYQWYDDTGRREVVYNGRATATPSFLSDPQQTRQILEQVNEQDIADAASLARADAAGAAREPELCTATNAKGESPLMCGDSRAR